MKIKIENSNKGTLSSHGNIFNNASTWRKKEIKIKRSMIIKEYFFIRLSPHLFFILVYCPKPFNMNLTIL
jgi:hypothetical protein